MIMDHTAAFKSLLSKLSVLCRWIYSTWRFVFITTKKTWGVFLAVQRSAMSTNLGNYKPREGMGMLKMNISYCCCYYSWKKKFSSGNFWKSQHRRSLKETAATESPPLNKLGNAGLGSWWSNSHSQKKCSTSRALPCCGHLLLSPTHLTSTPAVGQWTCNLVTAGHTPVRHTLTRAPHPAAAALWATQLHRLLSFLP